MSRRAFQLLRTSLRVFPSLPVQRAVARRTTFIKPSLNRHVNFVRCYATETPGGVPLPNADETEQALTPGEQERNELHKQAGYQNLLNRAYSREKVQANKLEEAVEIYNTLLSRTDLNRLEKRLAFFNLGVIHHRKGDTDKGIKYWQDVVSIPVTTTDALIGAEEIELAAAANMNLGAHFVLNKQMEKGLEYLQSAAELDPDDGEIRYNLAAALTAVGKHEEAIREFEASAERGIDIAKEVIKKLKEGLAENEKENAEK